MGVIMIVMPISSWIWNHTKPKGDGCDNLLDLCLFGLNA